MSILPGIILFFWAGFVCSISFMEAWIKFRAAGVTLPVGLSIGSKVFTALNRMEWVFFTVFLLIILSHFHLYRSIIVVFAGLVFIILLVQTFLLLPRLTGRANMIISGGVPAKSFTHLYYIVLEVLKVFLIVFSGFFILMHAVAEM